MSPALDDRTEARPRTTPDGRMTIAAVLDTVAVVVFVAAGRRTHEQDPGLAGVFLTAAPFLIALLAGWIVTRAWRRPFSLGTGLGVWAVAVAGGMLLRNLVFDRGTAPTFVVVTAAFVAACLLGWRLIAGLITRTR
ncbi:MAG: DUF3054 domain-containing protein [Ilumatobacteraceae bacterium]